MLKNIIFTVVVGLGQLGGFVPDMVRADEPTLEFLWAGCAEGHETICLRGSRAAQEQGDMARLRDFVDQGCRLGNAVACGDLGISYVTGLARPVDIEAGVPLLQKSCAAGHGQACAHLGWMYYTATGLPANLPRAFELFAEGCDKGSGLACRNISLMYDAGELVEKDAARAAELRDLACRRGDRLSCPAKGPG